MFVSKLSGNVSTTIDALVTSQYTSSHLKPKLAVDRRKSPHHAIEGLAQGSEFLSRTVVHGVAGLLGNPIRGAQAGLSATDSLVGFASGFASGTVGLFMSPFIGALGFVAKTSDGIAASTRCLDQGAVEARCRPAR